MAIEKNPDADLVMIFIEQPDGSGHQFTLTDRRQATDPRNPNSIGNNQDQAKIDRYDRYLKFAYQRADRAVKRIIEAAGQAANVFVVSDHGFENLSVGQPVEYQVDSSPNPKGKGPRATSVNPT